MVEFFVPPKSMGTRSGCWWFRAANTRSRCVMLTGGLLDMMFLPPIATKKQGSRVIARRFFAEAISTLRIGDRFGGKAPPRDDTWTFSPYEWRERATEQLRS